MDEINWLTIAAFNDESNAQTAKEFLGDIPSMVLPVTGGNYGVNNQINYASRFSACRIDTWLLQILPEDAEQVSQLIEEKWPEEFKAQIVRPAPPEKLMGPCPRCFSNTVVRHNVSTLDVIFCVLLLGIPALFYSPSYDCRNCGYHFKESDVKHD